MEPAAHRMVPAALQLQVVHNRHGERMDQGRRNRCLGVGGHHLDLEGENGEEHERVLRGNEDDRKGRNRKCKIAAASHCKIGDMMGLLPEIEWLLLLQLLLWEWDIWPSPAVVIHGNAFAESNSTEKGASVGLCCSRLIFLT